MNHTGRELALMLEGRKPLAMFYAFDFELPDEDFIPEAAFSVHVASGRFMRDEIRVIGSHSTSGVPCDLKYVFFARPGEEWRIPAMALVVRTYYRMGHGDEGTERIECALLGYTEEETNEWCNHHFRDRAV